ncbi:hypothetical protein GIW05_00130 [Pseudomonas syringae]|uniref:hypothetical protein n=1 Tax=Pseudomonas syringae TaxID=317 RepID=UPI001F365D44|nr:hypothetical protein [Pseudomonas syringae]MCF5381928.1 hypothetical protein [Pseudomonas syringae]MCF5423818.1 hypothetical protein [Pseudomonas syringae]MCF5455009.1 hypothetical protein [Pseudomonas syringae]MCF5460861.1 hypothetical protein [Pseudomonas syringae]
MLSTLTREIPNRRFLAYVALLYILALTGGVWVPASSPIFDNAPLVKLALLPWAQAFLLMGARHRWPSNFKTILLASCCFYAGVIASLIFNAYL